MQPGYMRLINMHTTCLHHIRMQPYTGHTQAHVLKQKGKASKKGRSDPSVEDSTLPKVSQPFALLHHVFVTYTAMRVTA